MAQSYQSTTKCGFLPLKPLIVSNVWVSNWSPFPIFSNRLARLRHLAAKETCVDIRHNDIRHNDNDIFINFKDHITHSSINCETATKDARRYFSFHCFVSTKSEFGCNMLSRISSVVCLTIFVGLLAFSGSQADKEIPTTRFSQNVGGPTMTFLYWWVRGSRTIIERKVAFTSVKWPDSIVYTGSESYDDGDNAIAMRFSLRQASQVDGDPVFLPQIQ